MIAVKNNLKSEIFPTKENKQIETIYCKIKLNDKPKQEMIVGSIYRPSNHNIQTSKEICEELADIRSDNSKAHFWVGGDFNLPDVNWTNNSHGNRYPKEIYANFITTKNNLRLDQIVELETRKNGKLDICFTDNPGLVEDQTILPGLGDHGVVVINSKLKPNRQKKKPHQICLWNNCDLVSMKEEIKKFDKTFKTKFSIDSDVNSMWSDIKDIFKSVTHKYVPKN